MQIYYTCTDRQHTDIPHTQVQKPTQILTDVYRDPQDRHTHKHTHKRRTDPEMHTMLTHIRGTHRPSDTQTHICIDTLA